MLSAIVLALGVATEYGKGSEVTLYANKVCSHVQAQMLHSDSCDFLSRSDHLQTQASVYAFYNLPYCSPTDIEIKREDLGPLLKGDRPTRTLYEIKFRENVGKACAKSTSRRWRSKSSSRRSLTTATSR